ncbi:MAG: CHC2 zinc finger domain-containing protein, partial [Planctomycetota bacterium]
LYYCFGCGQGGNTYKFLMEIGKQSFAEVVLDSVHSLHLGFEADDIDVDDSGIDGLRGIRTINLPYEHGLETGDPVRYTTDGVALGELRDDTRYYAIVIGGTQVALAESEEAADRGRDRIFLTDRLLDNGDASDGFFDTIDLYTEHGYVDGTQLMYVQNAGGDIGLVDGEIYTVRLLDADTTTLSTDSLSGEDVRASMVQLLDSNGNLIELNGRSSADGGPSLLIDISVRLDVTPEVDSTNVHYLTNDAKIELDASVASGNQHQLRLGLSTLGTTTATHGFGRTFVADGSTSNLTGDESDDTIDLGYAHGFSAGQAVIYSSGWGAPIGGLSEAQVYFVRLVDGSDTQIQLAETEELALANTDNPELIEFNTAVATGSNHTITPVFNPSVVVDGASDTINFGRLHGLTTGEQLVYENGGGTSIGGLVDGEVYTVRVVDSKIIQLTVGSSSNDAIDLDASVATGGNHIFAEPSAGDIAQITVGGEAGLVATNTGQIISVTLAGTIATSPDTNKYTGAGWSS